MSRIIVNAVTPEYQNGQDRLRMSLFTHAHGIDFSGMKINKALHLDNPYSFKITAFETALSGGYKRILWLDASCYAIKPIRRIFDIIDTKGYFMEYSGHEAGRWTNDRTLEYFGITRDEAMKIPMFSAGFTGIDMGSIIGKIFFDEWKRSMVAGCFKGAWDNNSQTESKDPRCEGHRHDMACASIIAYKLGMTYEPGNSYFQYGSPESELNHDKIIFKLQGI